MVFRVYDYRLELVSTVRRVSLFNVKEEEWAVNVGAMIPLSFLHPFSL